MIDCTYLTLYYSKEGYVVKCVHCNKIQMAFGNVMINLTLEGFHNLRTETIEKIKEHKHTGFPDQKSITFYTDSTTIMLVFSFKDLEILYEMLQQANLMLEVNNILSNQN